MMKHLWNISKLSSPNKYNICNAHQFNEIKWTQYNTIWFFLTKIDGTTQFYLIRASQTMVYCRKKSSIVGTTTQLYTMILFKFMSMIHVHMFFHVVINSLPKWICYMSCSYPSSFGLSFKDEISLWILTFHT